MVEMSNSALHSARQSIVGRVVLVVRLVHIVQLVHIGAQVTSPYAAAVWHTGGLGDPLLIRTSRVRR